MKKMTLNQWFTGLWKENPMIAMKATPKLLELASIQDYFTTMYGIEIEINVLPAKIQKGRWWSKGIAEEIIKQKPL